MKKKEVSFPSALTVLFIVLIFAAIIHGSCTGRTLL